MPGEGLDGAAEDRPRDSRLQVNGLQLIEAGEAEALLPRPSGEGQTRGGLPNKSSSYQPSSFPVLTGLERDPSVLGWVTCPTILLNRWSLFAQSWVESKRWRLDPDGNLLVLRSLSKTEI